MKLLSVKLWQYLAYKYKEIIFDKIQGVDFVKPIYMNNLGYDSKKVHTSSTTPSKYLTAVLKSLHITNKDAIIDIGCGKGGGMRQMLKFDFNKIDGIELSEYIVNIAKNNFKKIGTKRCTVFKHDASTFAHYSKYNVFYLYNPFPENIMSPVIDNIVQSIDNKNIMIIYNNPTCHTTLKEKGFTVIAKFPSSSGNKIYVYSRKNND